MWKEEGRQKENAGSLGRPAQVLCAAPPKYSVRLASHYQGISPVRNLKPSAMEMVQRVSGLSLRKVGR